MKKLYFIRHGESEANAQMVYAHPHTPLSANGIDQARAAGQKMKNIKIDLIVSSTYKRAQQTAEIIAKEIGYPKNKILFSELLIERRYTGLEGQPWVPLQEKKEIESVNDLLERGRQAFKYIKALPQDNILVVGHGTFGRALRHHFVQDEPFIDFDTNPDPDPAKHLANAEVVCWI